MGGTVIFSSATGQGSRQDPQPKRCQALPTLQATAQQWRQRRAKQVLTAHESLRKLGPPCSDQRRLSTSTSRSQQVQQQSVDQNTVYGFGLPPKTDKGLTGYSRASWVISSSSAVARESWATHHTSKNNQTQSQVYTFQIYNWQ